ncbi:peptidylprolyl isomerase [Cereibacter sphaeroides]|uniref:peptidylprolyl isomerase n=1 Tax=Cereibacter sphaeroides TaxID=1063 RepID=UPI001F3EF0FF|nr:peptidylprolyl isomerase [Cereibacter sphaeroides]MCE6952841.1 peptidylprolyl isomerase [Cereibacter sphaeroides]
MKTIASHCLALAVATALSVASVTGAPAQSLFSPHLVVNDKVITNFELEQRIRFLTLLGAPGDVEKQAVDALIDDKLRMDAAEAAGIEATEEQIREGMDEFAGRANLTGEQFVTELGKAGVSAETFRDFVHAGLVWRELVRAKFGPLARPSELAIDRAITNQTRRAAVRLLLSEIIIPAPPGEEAEVLALAREISAGARGEAAFAEAAREYSAAPSAERGGRIDWVPLQNLPPTLGPVLLTLQPGEVTEPLKIPNAVALFQLRGIAESDEPAPEGIEVEYAELFLPDDEALPEQLGRIASRTDNCDDLYTVMKGAPPEQLRRQKSALAAVPQDVALELARLDAGEISSGLRSGATRRVLMLCARRPLSEEPLDRGRIGQMLVNQTMGAMADGYLADLRAKAIIREP